MTGCKCTQGGVVQNAHGVVYKIMQVVDGVARLVNERHGYSIFRQVGFVEKYYNASDSGPRGGSAGPVVDVEGGA